MDSFWVRNIVFMVNRQDHPKKVALDALKRPRWDFLPTYRPYPPQNHSESLWRFQSDLQGSSTRILFGLIWSSMRQKYTFPIQHPRTRQNPQSGFAWCADATSGARQCRSPWGLLPQPPAKFTQTAPLLLRKVGSRFRKFSGASRPRYAQLSFCVAGAYISIFIVISRTLIYAQ